MKLSLIINATICLSCAFLAVFLTIHFIDKLSFYDTLKMTTLCFSIAIAILGSILILCRKEIKF